MKKILVTGGCGFIGSHLTDSLVEKGYQVSVLDREPPPVWQNAKARYIQRNICDNLDDMMSENFDAIYHLAAEVGSGISMAEPQKYVQTNSLGTINLLEAMRKSGRYSKVIVASSATVYGEATYQCQEHGIFYPDFRPKEQLENRDWETKCSVCAKESEPLPIKEERPLKPGNIYGLTKLDQEIMCLRLGKAWGFPVVVFRPFGVFGPRQSLKNPYTGVLALFAVWFLTGSPIRHYEDGKQNKGYIYITDAVNAFLLALEAKEADGKVFNLGLPKPVTIRHIAEKMANKINPSVEIIRTGKFRTGDTRHSWPDVSYLEKALNWRPEVSFDDGLDILIDWLKTIPKEQVKEAVSSFETAEKYAKSFGLEI